MLFCVHSFTALRSLTLSPDSPYLIWIRYHISEHLLGKIALVRYILFLMQGCFICTTCESHYLAHCTVPIISTPPHPNSRRHRFVSTMPHDPQTSNAVHISHGIRPSPNSSLQNTFSLPRYPQRTARGDHPNNIRSTDIPPTSHHMHSTSTSPAVNSVCRRSSSASLSLFTIRLKKVFTSSSQSSDNLTPLAAWHDKARNSSGFQPSRKLPFTAIETLQAVRLTLHSSFEGLLGIQVVQGSALADVFASMLPNFAAQNALGIFFNVTRAVQVFNYYYYLLIFNI